MDEITTVEIPKEIEKNFEILAKETHMPKMYHIEKALKIYLKQFDKLGSEIVLSDDDPEPDLNKIDVMVETRPIYQYRLRKSKAESEKKEHLDSPFLSSSPVDLGYTDASMLDQIIAGDD